MSGGVSVIVSGGVVVWWCRCDGHGLGHGHGRSVGVSGGVGAML